MPTVSYPGVYVEEIASGVRPLEAASTSTTAFVGLAEMGPPEATRLTSWTEFLRRYGSFIPNSYLAQSVLQYFNNGGRQCYLVRAARADAATASVTVVNRASTPAAGLTFSARNSGAWGNSLLLSIGDGTLDPGSEFRLSVRRQQDPAVVPENFRDIAPLEDFDNLSMDPTAPNFAPAVLRQRSTLVELQVLKANAGTQRGLHRGGTRPTLPLNANLSFLINLDGDGFQQVTLPPAVGAATKLTDVAAAIQTAVAALTRRKTSTDPVAFTGFSCTIEGGDVQERLVLRSGTDSVGSSSVAVQSAATGDATTQLRLGSATGGRSENGLALRRPANTDGLPVGRHRGGTAPTLPLGDDVVFQINLDGDGFRDVTLPTAAGTSTKLAEVAAAIQTVVSGLTRQQTFTDAAAYSRFTCTVDGVDSQARLVLQSGSATSASSVAVQPAAQHDASVKLRLGAANGGAAERELVSRPGLQVGDAAVAGPVTAVVPGTDGTAKISELTFSDTFSRLDAITDVSLLAVPGEGTTAMFDLATGYCANRPLKDIFYIGEMTAQEETAQDAEEFREGLKTANSYGAVYFPWVKALDPTGQSSAPILLPPAGYLAGLYARIDATRGVWKAPAGVEASLTGVVGLVAELSDVQHGNLNPRGVAVLRRFPTAGIVAFGARTVSADPEWRYIPVRRTAIMLRVSIYHGIQWAVFEPNDEPLWSQLRLNIGAFMMTLFRQGAFQGATPSQAFFVKCDGETTTQADIDAGVVNVLVGFAPLKPAEFVVVKISQKAGLATG